MRQKTVLSFLLPSWLECQNMCTTKFWQLESAITLRDIDDKIVRFFFLSDSEEKVWQYTYIYKMLKEMEIKYIVMSTEWKALPFGAYDFQGHHCEVRHIEYGLVFLNGKRIL